MDKSQIKEIIVVEGKDDTVAVKRVFDVETIETNGSALSEKTIKKIKFAQEKMGVIIFTDPDYTGEKIRNDISKQVPKCKHAFLTKEKALSKNKKSIGVEHASDIDIINALKNAQLVSKTNIEEITFFDLQQLGIISGIGSRKKRDKLGEILKIGYANSKQFHRRLMLFGISFKQLKEALKKIK